MPRLTKAEKQKLEQARIRKNKVRLFDTLVRLNKIKLQLGRLSLPVYLSVEFDMVEAHIDILCDSSELSGIEVKLTELRTDIWQDSSKVVNLSPDDFAKGASRTGDTETIIVNLDSSETAFVLLNEGLDRFEAYVRYQIELAKEKDKIKTKAKSVLSDEERKILGLNF